MFLTADFGATATDASYTLLTATGGDAQARTSSGVVDLENGAYGVEIDLPPVAVAIRWDTGTATSVYAHEDLTEAQNNIFLRNRHETNQTTGKATFYRDDGTTVYMEGDAFEDQAGATPYAGNGIERRDRLAT